MWCDRHNVRLKTVVFNIKPKHTQFSTTLFVALACFSLFAVSLLLLLLLLVPFIVVSVVFLSIWFFFSCARLRFACTYEMHAEYLSWRGFFFAHQLSSYCLQRGVFDVFLNQNPTSFISKSFEWISWKISFKNVIKVVTTSKYYRRHRTSKVIFRIFLLCLAWTVERKCSESSAVCVEAYAIETRIVLVIHGPIAWNEYTSPSIKESKTFVPEAPREQQQ